MANINNLTILDMRNPTKIFDSFSYPAGELQVRLTKNAMNLLDNAESVGVINNINYPASIIETILFLSAVDGKISPETPRFLILPYLPYSRADRRFVDGDCSGKEAFLKMIPSNWKIVTFDIHSDKNSGENVINITPENVLKKIFKKYNFENVVFPDAGAHSRYAKMFDTIGFFPSIYFCEKKRDVETGKFLGFTVPEIYEKNKRTIIIDDLCDGGGTFLGIAKELNVDKSNLFLYVSHGIFSKGLSELSEFFTTIITTNSIEYNEEYPNWFQHDFTINLENINVDLEIINIDREYREISYV